MSKSHLKKKLYNLDKRILINLIFDLYDKNVWVKEYLDYYVTPNELEKLTTYKKKVREAFYPKQGFGPKLSAGKKVISDFRKLEPSPDSLIDLMIHYVECGVEFTNEFGDIDERFYSSLESVYHNTLKLIDKNGLHEKYRSRAYKIFEDTRNIGWGFHDSLSYFYYEFYD